jgi:hypothetical protein
VPTRKLPRVPHADRPRPDEEILKQGGVDLQNGWLARHGTLYLSLDRMVFVPTPLDTAMRAKRREILLDELMEVERVPLGADEMIAGGMRPRLLLSTEETTYVIMTGDNDAWLDAIDLIYERRQQLGKPHRPRILRKTKNLYRLGREA